MTVNKTASLRILHVLGSLNRGGVETWLMHMLRHLDQDRFHFDFLVHDDAPGAYDAEARSFGSRIIPCIETKQPWNYARNFHHIMQQYGPYDVVHSHVHHYSGYVLRLAYKAAVPKRIAHSHNDTLQAQQTSGLSRKLYFALMKRWIEQYSTARLAASHRAAQALFNLSAPKQRENPVKIVFYGLDFAPFYGEVSPSDIRSELGIPENAHVVGHVGRFDPQKNHAFILEIANRIISQHDTIYFLLIGDGILRATMQQKTREMGISEKVVFTGVRPDVPRLMRGAIDLFLLPSLFEGLGIVLVEAQAAGLTCLVSDVIPEEADVVPHLVERLSLQAPVEQWIVKMIEMKKLSRENIIKQQEALAKVENSIFALNRCMEQLEDVYCR